MHGPKVETILLVFICLFACVMGVSPTLIKPSTIDIHLHDTYYIVSGRYISFFLLLYCLLLFALYKMLRRRTGGVHFFIAFTHIMATIFFIVIFVGSGYFITSSRPRRYIDFANAMNWSSYMNFRFLLTMFFIIAQTGFFFYFFVQWFRTRRRI